MAGDKLRVGVIGANVSYGWGPRAHLPAILGMPNVELAAVCTAHEDTARESAEKFGAPMAFHNHHDLLKQDDIDVVAVVVRVPLHYQLTMDALAAGRNVYTEWPLGANLHEAEEMANLAKEKGVQTMVGLQGRCAPATLRLKELLDEGFVGEVLSCHLTQFGSGVLTRTSDRTWQKDVELGANTLTISFGHAIDSMCMAVGEFKEVSAVVSTQVPQWHETDTNRMVNVTSPDNILVSGTLESGAVASAHVSSVPFHGSGYRLEVYGRDGTLVLTSDQGAHHIGGIRLLGGKAGASALEELPIPSHLTQVPDSVPTGPPYNVAKMWNEFAVALQNGKRVRPDFADAVTRHRLIDAIQRSSDTGKRQPV